MKEIKTNKGVLKYRLPNIAEGYDYLCLVDQVSTAQDIFRIRGVIINKMGDLINYKELGYSNYDEVLNDKENMRDILASISKEVFDDVIELISKKN
jgi:hypothetical protein